MSTVDSWTFTPDYEPIILDKQSDAEVKTPILWPPDAKNQLIGKDSGAGKD